MEQSDYILIGVIVLIIVGVLIFFLFFRKKSDFKAPVMDGNSVFLAQNQISDTRPSMIYVHRGCPCSGQPMAQIFQNLATEMQAYGGFYQEKEDPNKIYVASIQAPYIALFVGGRLITAFQANSLQDLQSFFLKMVGNLKTNVVSSPPTSIPFPGGVPPGVDPTPPGGKIADLIPGGGVNPGGGNITDIMKLLPGGGGGGGGGNITDIMKMLPGGGGGGGGILGNVGKNVGPIINTVLTNTSTSDIRNILTSVTGLIPGTTDDTVVGLIPDSAIELARNFLIGMTRTQTMYSG